VGTLAASLCLFAALSTSKPTILMKIKDYSSVENAIENTEISLPILVRNNEGIAAKLIGTTAC